MAERRPLALDDILAALTARGCKPTPSADGNFKARCPAHDDRNPSLSVGAGHTGKPLLHCHAGCAFTAILAALDLDTSGPPARIAPIRPRRPAAIRDRLPDSRTRYDYRDADGRITTVVLRDDPATGKRIRQWRPADGGWQARAGPAPHPLYRLPELLAAPPERRIALVEGEKCVHAILRAWPGQTPTTWLGGTAAWRKTDWQPLAGRGVSVLADADEAGRKTARAIARHLAEMGCDVRIALPAGTDGADVADWIEQHGPAGAARKIRDLLEPFDAPALTVLPDAPAPALDRNEHFQVLGLAGELVAIRIAVGRILVRARESLCVPNNLISLAPLTWWIAQTGEASMNTALARQIGDQLIRLADRIGQVDLSQVRGRGGYRDEAGAIYWHLGDRVMLRDGTDLTLAAAPGLCVSEPRVEIGDAADPRQRAYLADAVMGYRWRTPDDGRRLMGWIVTALIGGALEWRPHAMLVAPAAAGKSWILQRVIEPIMGPLALRIASGTEAALARATAASSLPVLVDEAEAQSGWIASLLPLLRIAAGGAGQRIRADQTGTGVVYQEPRFSALLSAVSMPTLTGADASRIAMIRLGESVRDWPTVRDEILTSVARATDFRAAIVRATWTIAETARTITERLIRDGEPTRGANISGALTAGWRWWSGQDDEIVRPATVYGDGQYDAVDLLHGVLALPARGPHGEESTVGRLIRSGIRRVADLYGLRITDGSLLIACRHAGLRQRLARTEFASIDPQRLLADLPGVTETPHPRRFGSTRARALVLTPSVLHAAGVDLAPDPVPDSHEV